MTSFNYEDAVNRLAQTNGWAMYLNDENDAGFLWSGIDLAGQERTLRLIYVNEGGIASDIAKASIEEYKSQCTANSRAPRWEV